MMAAMLRGATIDTILSGFACEGAAAIRDALTIPSGLNNLLVTRLLKTPDEVGRNWSLFAFLAWRASDQVFKEVLANAPELLERDTWSAQLIKNDPKIWTHSRAHRLGLLAASVREDTARKMEAAANEEYDLSYFGDEEMLDLIPATRLLALGMKLRADGLANVSDRITSIAEDADLDEDPDSHFETINEALDALEAIVSDGDASNKIEGARRRISEEVEKLNERKEVRDSEKEDEPDWTQISSVSEEIVEVEPKIADARPRSIFDDVDR
jgi:hypothetical protein